MNWIIYVAVGIAAGIIAAVVMMLINRRRLTKENARLVSEAKKEAETLLREARIEAESLKKDKILQAKEKFIELKAEHEKIINQKNRKIAESEQRASHKEARLSQML